MKKLESLSLDKFKNERLSKNEQLNVFGGVATNMSDGSTCSDTISDPCSKEDGTYPDSDVDQCSGATATPGPE